MKSIATLQGTLPFYFLFLAWNSPLGILTSIGTRTVSEEMTQLHKQSISTMHFFHNMTESQIRPHHQAIKYDHL